MSNKEAQEERRLSQCARTNGKIVKQFDELIKMMDTRSRLSKRRKALKNYGIYNKKEFYEERKMVHLRLNNLQWFLSMKISKVQTAKIIVYLVEEMQSLPEYLSFPESSMD